MSDFDNLEEIVKNVILSTTRDMGNTPILSIAAKMTELEYQEHTKRLLMGVFPFERVFDKWIRILKNIESHP